MTGSSCDTGFRVHCSKGAVCVLCVNECTRPSSEVRSARFTAQTAVICDNFITMSPGLRDRQPRNRGSIPGRGRRLFSFPKCPHSP